MPQRMDDRSTPTTKDKPIVGGTYRRPARKYEGGFDPMPRKLAQDTSLSFEAVGLLAYLLSKPDDWEGLVGDIESRGRIGYEKRRRITIEAEEAGYLAYRRVRRPDGTWSQFYEVFDIPLPPEERTNSKIRPTPGNPGTVEPPPVNPSPVNPGSYITENSHNQELNKRETQSVTSELKTEEELQTLTGEQPTDDDKLVAQQLLFLREGKTFDVHKGPELLAWVQNTRRVYKEAGVAKLLDAHQKPEEYGITRSWARWKIDAHLFEANTKPKAVTTVMTNSTTIRIAACSKYQPLRKEGIPDDELIRRMTEEYGVDIAYSALAFMKLDNGA